MTTFNVIVYETNAITLQVEAEDDIEAARLVEADINSYEVLDEEVIDWNVDFVEEVDNVTSEDSNCMQTFIPGFHD